MTVRVSMGVLMAGLQQAVLCYNRKKLCYSCTVDVFLHVSCHLVMH
jgi:hypothetical protein